MNTKQLIEETLRELEQLLLPQLQAFCLTLEELGSRTVLECYGQWPHS